MTKMTSLSAKAAVPQKWGIKVFADMFGVTPRTIRFYEDKGLLAPQREGGIRTFGPRDRLRFEKIMRGKRLGFSLDDIRAVFDITDGNVTDRAEIARRKANFEAVVASLAERRRDLDILHADMTEVITIADEALQSAPGSGTVADLAARYQAAFDASTTGHPIDFNTNSDITA
jgi:DNA-binding transcriptional MerR regulator